MEHMSYIDIVKLTKPELLELLAKNKVPVPEGVSIYQLRSLMKTVMADRADALFKTEVLDLNLMEAVNLRRG